LGRCCRLVNLVGKDVSNREPIRRTVIPNRPVRGIEILRDVMAETDSDGTNFGIGFRSSTGVVVVVLEWVDFRVRRSSREEWRSFQETVRSSTMRGVHVPT
jgi:hypothetical protein